MPFPNKETQFKKGKSGNPKGRPKIPDINEALGEILSDEKDGVSALKAVLMTMRKRAINGDARCAEILLDRAYGKSKTHTDITSNGETIVVAPVKWADE